MALPHVLVAEDSTEVCAAMRVLFEACDYRVSTAGHVAKIVGIATADPVDLLLLDLGLADGDGFEVLDALRASGHMPRVVVALTGREEQEIETRCLAAGCKAVLVKPVAIRELMRLSAEWLAPGSAPD